MGKMEEASGARGERAGEHPALRRAVTPLLLLFFIVGDLSLIHI